jgi:hypothetical protein
MDTETKGHHFLVVPQDIESLWITEYRFIKV